MQEERKTPEMRAQMTDIERLRHSASHVLATAILKIWPEAQFAAGPPVENGFYYDVDLELARLSAIAQRGEPSFLPELERFIPRNFHPFEWMVCFDFLLHLRLDLLEIVRRNPVRKIDIVIKSVIDWWPGCELRLRPDFQNGRRQDMRSRMPQTFDVCHRCAHLGSFAFFLHPIGR